MGASAWPETPMSSPLDFITFKQTALAQGFDEVTERDWAPGQVLETHRHPFSVDALVVHGEMWLTQGDTTRHLRAGERFELARDVPHAERYGPEGAVVWVARLHGRAERDPED
jgi:hypothetical protein